MCVVAGRSEALATRIVRRLPLTQHAHDEREACRHATAWQWQRPQRHGLTEPRHARTTLRHAHLQCHANARAQHKVVCARVLEEQSGWQVVWLFPCGVRMGKTETRHHRTRMRTTMTVVENSLSDMECWDRGGIDSSGGPVLIAFLPSRPTVPTEEELAVSSTSSFFMRLQALSSSRSTVAPINSSTRLACDAGYHSHHGRPPGDTTVRASTSNVSCISSRESSHPRWHGIRREPLAVRIGTTHGTSRLLRSGINDSEKGTLWFYEH